MELTPTGYTFGTGKRPWLFILQISPQKLLLIHRTMFPSGLRFFL